MSKNIQHYLNPLHVYCRLRNMGVSKGTAVSCCRFYEKHFFNVFIIRREMAL
jgi:hypothetical protein